MPNQAAINPSAEQAAMRNIGRVRTLRAAIAKARSRGNTDREAQLQAELDRRLAEIATLKTQLESI